MYTNILALLLLAGVAGATPFDSVAVFTPTSLEATSRLSLVMQVSAGDLFGNFYPGDIASMPSGNFIAGLPIKALEWWDGTAQVTVDGKVYQGLGGGWTQITGVLPEVSGGGLDYFPISWSMDVLFSESLFSLPIFEVKGSGVGIGVLDEKNLRFTYVSTPEPGTLWATAVGIGVLLYWRSKHLPAQDHE